MARRTSLPWPGLNPLLAVVAVVVFVWGLERWRRDAASRADHSEAARFLGLTRCLLGPDGATLLRSPDATRRRLRALAMATPAEPSLTWIDRCVPLARALHHHASEVDNTRPVTAVQTRLAEGARRLLEAVDRVGLAWRVRAGDPETDMDPIADQLVHVATEIELAGARVVGAAGSASDPRDPVAVVPEPLPDGARVATPGLEPTPAGTPARLLAGMPLPALGEVARDGAGAWQLRPLANGASLAWSARSATVVRVAATPAAGDGTAPLQVFSLTDAPPAIVDARVAAVNSPLAALHVALDAVTARGTLWLAEWTPWAGTVLTRFAPDAPPTPVVLAPPVPGDTARATSAATGASTARDERVAVARVEAGLVVAYTTRQAPDEVRLNLVAAATDDDNVPVLEIDQRSVVGHHPGLEFCGRPDGALVLLVAAESAWLALRVTPADATELLRLDAPEGRAFDERVTVRCTDDGVVAYAREHTADAPVVLCRDVPGARTRCAAVALPPTPELVTMPAYVTRAPSGRALAHAAWPTEVALAGDALVVARAAGPVVSVARRERDGGAWSAERVVFDAAAHAHGEVVVGLGLYAAGTQATLAAASSDGLHVLGSDDGGATWR